MGWLQLSLCAAKVHASILLQDEPWELSSGRQVNNSRMRSPVGKHEHTHHLPHHMLPPQQKNPNHLSSGSPIRRRNSLDLASKGHIEQELPDWLRNKGAGLASERLSRFIYDIPHTGGCHSPARGERLHDGAGVCPIPNVFSYQSPNSAS